MHKGSYSDWKVKRDEGAEVKVLQREKLTRAEKLAWGLRHYEVWRKLPEGERFPYTPADFARYYQVREKTLEEWDIKLNHKEARLEAEIRQEGKIEDEDGFDVEDPTAWWVKRTIQINRAILESAKRGNAQSQKLAKQLAGELVEKSEVKVGLTAEELYRRNLEAERELAEFRKGLGQGVVEKQE